MSNRPTQHFSDVDEIIKYGKKHRGTCVGWVIVHDYKYIQWALEEGVVTFSPDVAHLVDACRDPDSKQFIVPCRCKKGLYCPDEMLSGVPITMKCGCCGHTMMTEDLAQLRDAQLSIQEEV